MNSLTNFPKTQNGLFWMWALCENQKLFSEPRLQLSIREVARLPVLKVRAVRMIFFEL